STARCSRSRPRGSARTGRCRRRREKPDKETGRGETRRPVVGQAVPGGGGVPPGGGSSGTAWAAQRAGASMEDFSREEEVIRHGGGPQAARRQHAKNRLTARERISQLCDAGPPFFELGLWAAWGMYRDWGGAPSAGVVTGIGRVAGRQAMVIAND